MKQTRSLPGTQRSQRRGHSEKRPSTQYRKPPSGQGIADCPSSTAPSQSSSTPLQASSTGMQVGPGTGAGGIGVIIIRSGAASVRVGGTAIGSGTGAASTVATGTSSGSTARMPGKRPQEPTRPKTKGHARSITRTRKARLICTSPPIDNRQREI